MIDARGYVSFCPPEDKQNIARIRFYDVTAPELVVGTCGFSARGGRRVYFKTFPAVEVQDTFYRIVRKATLEKWRREAPEWFEYTVKAFQGVSHPPSSPTWRRSNLKIPAEKRDKYGYFRPTEEVMESWLYTLDAAKTLGSRFIVIQTPASFRPTPENIENIRSFFKRAPRDGFYIGWEPRGEWNNMANILQEVFSELGLVHVVDPFRRREVVETEVRYYRLHGRGGREVNYRYRYTDEDLEELLEYVSSLNARRVYIMFNNVYMFEDAKRFMEKALEAGLNVKKPG